MASNEPAAGARTSGCRSGLERVLRTDAFAVTAELVPPLSSDAKAVAEQAAALGGLADAVNVTDGSGARVHMSALAAAAILLQNGIEPVLQLTCRDRNRLALQGDLLGAAALGIRNILCLRGDDLGKGDQPEAKAVFDLGARELIATAQRMRDAGELPNARPIQGRPEFFIGAADTPTDPLKGGTSDALKSKLALGIDFVQTQFCFDASLIERYVSRLGQEGIIERLYLLVGLGPLVSARSARWMRDNLGGAVVPDAVIERLERATDPRTEGRKICIELMQRLREIEGVAGVHLMAPRGREAIPEIIEASGVVKGRPPLPA